ncbi:GNAT family N-acetyltransferase [Phreatobacter sp.]|uniref:GNAT family N-acetyltransferase n=1 Tax=Phreatobacter sp. TaxID=1966341 RepID=UPI003F72BBB0
MSQTVETPTIDALAVDPAGSSGAASAGRRGHVRILDSFAAAAPLWTALQQLCPHSGYQLFAWQEAFQRHLGGTRSLCLAAIHDPLGAPLGLMPLSIERRQGLGLARFIGGSHVNFSMGLWRPDAGRVLGAAGAASVLGQIAQAAPSRIDLFALTGQPHVWEGVDNPLAALSHRPSPSFGYGLDLDADAEAVLARVVSPNSRRKMRKKERNLAEIGPVAFTVAGTPSDIQRLADLFLVWKAERFRALGIHNVFAEPGMRSFILDAAGAGLGQADPALELCALTVAGEPVAIFGGTIARGRYSGMFNAMAPGDIQKDSPGELLLHHLVRYCCERGLTVFDLGAGEAQYKQNLCDRVEPLFDQFIAVTWRGQLATRAMAARAAAKREVKQSPTLWAIVQRFRRMRAGRGDGLA